MIITDELRSMTYDQLRNWWAMENGYKNVARSEFVTVPHWIDSDGEPVWDAECMLAAHPIEDTLDAIAALLPNGWVWLKVCGDGGHIVWEAWNSDHTEQGRKIVHVVETIDEKHDRLLLACLVLLAERGGDCEHAWVRTPDPSGGNDPSFDCSKCGAVRGSK